MSSEPNQNEKELRGFFLYDETVPELTTVAAAWHEYVPRPYWGEIKAQPVQLNMPAFIPTSLQADANAWLLLYHKNSPYESLVFPYPASEQMAIFDTIEQCQEQLDILLEIIRGEKRFWYPSTGYVQLNENVLDRLGNRYRSDRPKLTRFQIVRHEQTVDELLAMTNQPASTSNNQQIQERIVIIRTNDELQNKRQEMLAQVLDDAETVTDAVAEFEKVILDQSTTLAADIIKNFKVSLATPKIVAKYESILDPETVKMLRTATTIARFIRKSPHQPILDFTIAGCGLWKAVERELNLSVIWHIRRRRGVADKDPLIIPRHNQRLPLYIEGTDINQASKDNPKMFAGITLGSVNHMLRTAQRSGIDSDFVVTLGRDMNPLLFRRKDNNIRGQIDQVVPIRNRFSHIAAMPYQQYRILSRLILRDSDESPCLLSQVLELKQSIIQYWQKQN
ncbi:MAG TPA: hypothetical protein VLL52_05360 [Anaerolineae bacterium]|nr:hypothetical protein [Anaerolineae bacterium]